MIVVNTGLAWLAERLREIYQGAPVQIPIFLELYQNDFEIIPATTWGQVQPANFNSYLPVQLDHWAAPTITADDRVYMGEILHTWTKAAGGVGNSIKGWVVRDQANVLLWGHSYPALRDMHTDGNRVDVTPSWLEQRLESN